MTLVGSIPRWVKVAALERGCMTAIEKRELMVLSLAPLERTGPVHSKAFTQTEYASDAGRCWMLVLEEYDTGAR